MVSTLNFGSALNLNSPLNSDLLYFGSDWFHCVVFFAANPTQRESFNSVVMIPMDLKSLNSDSIRISYGRVNINYVK